MAKTVLIVRDNPVEFQRDLNATLQQSYMPANVEIKYSTTSYERKLAGPNGGYYPAEDVVLYSALIIY